MQRRFAELAVAQPGRFLAWAFLPMQDPVAAAAELRRCVREHGFVGGHVATNVRGTYLPDEAFRPIFEAASELDVPLFCIRSIPGRDRTGDYELTVVAGYLFDSTINVLRMICSNFLDRYGGLKLVCAHTGAFSLMLRNRMQREVDTNAALSRTLPRKVGDYLRGLYFDTVCFEPDYLRYAAGIVPAEHLLLGSDAPFPLGEADPVNFVRKAPAARGGTRAVRQFSPHPGGNPWTFAGCSSSATPSTARGRLPALTPVTRVAACAVIANPLAGTAHDDLGELVPLGAELGDLLVERRSPSCRTRR